MDNMRPEDATGRITLAGSIHSLSTAGVELSPRDNCRDQVFAMSGCAGWRATRFRPAKQIDWGSLIRLPADSAATREPRIWYENQRSSAHHKDEEIATMRPTPINCLRREWPIFRLSPPTVPCTKMGRRARGVNTNHSFV